uniref:Uncharacterized protein n=1 Tax=Moniliophthora roreri TaxID=221103 RepID=A0A0W0G723_MONRR
MDVLEDFANFEPVVDLEALDCAYLSRNIDTKGEIHNFAKSIAILGSMYDMACRTFLKVSIPELRTLCGSLDPRNLRSLGNGRFDGVTDRNTTFILGYKYRIGDQHVGVPSLLAPTK